MEKIIQERASGKTAKLIKRSAQTGDYIVCYSLAQASNVQLRANDMGLKIPFPISFREFIKGEYGRDGIKGFLIDDLDFCIQSYITVPINAITMSNEKKLISDVIQNSYLFSYTNPIGQTVYILVHETDIKKAHEKLDRTLRGTRCFHIKCLTI